MLAVATLYKNSVIVANGICSILHSAVDELSKSNNRGDISRSEIDFDAYSGLLLNHGKSPVNFYGRGKTAIIFHLK